MNKINEIINEIILLDSLLKIPLAKNLKYAYGCGNCPYNDGRVYTSDPPQYKCTITGNFHYGNDRCNVESKNE